MKKLYSFDKFINEGVRDMMTPKSKEDLRKHIDTLVPGEKLRKGMELGVLSKREARDMIDRLSPEFRLVYGKKYDLLSEREIHDVFITLPLYDKIRFMIDTNYRYPSDKLKEEFLKLSQKEKQKIIEVGYYANLLGQLWVTYVNVSDRIMEEGIDKMLKRLRKVSAKNISKSKRWGRKELFISEGIRDMMTPISKEDIRELIKKNVGTNKDIISVRFNCPFNDEQWMKLRKQLKNTVIKIVVLNNLYLKVTGDVFDVYEFYMNYFGVDGLMAIDFLKREIIKGSERLDEGVRDMMTPKSAKDIERAQRLLFDKTHIGWYEEYTDIKPIVDEAYQYIKSCGFRIISEPMVFDYNFGRCGFVFDNNISEFDDKYKSFKLIYEFSPKKYMLSVFGKKIYQYEILAYDEIVPWYNRETEKLSLIMKLKIKLEELTKNDEHKIILEGIKDKMTPKSYDDGYTEFLKKDRQEMSNSLYGECIELFAPNAPYDETPVITDEFCEFLKKEIGFDVWSTFRIDLKKYINFDMVLEDLTKEQLVKIFEFIYDKKLNEGVRDMMTPKSEEDIRKDISKAPIPNQFIRACQGGYLDIVKQTLQSVKDSRDYLSLVYMGMRKSIEGGFLDIFKYLVNNTELNYLHHNHEELLRSAAENGYTDIVKYLLTLGVDVHVHDEEPLFKSIYFGHVDCAKLLLDSGAKLQRSFIRKDNTPEMKKFLLQYNKTNEGVRDKMTPRHMDDIRQSFKDKGYRFGWQLLSATYSCDVDGVEPILDLMYDVYTTTDSDEIRETIANDYLNGLDSAVKDGSYDMVELYLSYDIPGLGMSHLRSVINSNYAGTAELVYDRLKDGMSKKERQEVETKIENKRMNESVRDMMTPKSMDDIIDSTVDTILNKYSEKSVLLSKKIFGEPKLTYYDDFDNMDKMMKFGNGIYVSFMYYPYYDDLKKFMWKKNVSFSQVPTSELKIWSHDKIKIVVRKMVEDIMNDRLDTFVIRKFNNLMR